VTVIRGARTGLDADRAHALPRRCGNHVSHGFVCRLSIAARRKVAGGLEDPHGLALIPAAFGFSFAHLT
jgi:hypothetical protein